jgi:hypothetical protein
MHGEVLGTHARLSFEGFLPVVASGFRVSLSRRQLARTLAIAVSAAQVEDRVIEVVELRHVRLATWHAHQPRNSIDRMRLSAVSMEEAMFGDTQKRYEQVP